MRTSLILMVLLLGLSCRVTGARELHDVQFADTVTLPGTQQALQLNGLGYRTKFFFKIYIGALYTTSKVKTPGEVLLQTGPNRVLMHFLYSEVSHEQLADAWNEGFEDNVPPDKLTVLRKRVDQFNAMFPTLHSGDVVLLDYIPGEGTVVTIKGEKKGVIKGEDFNHALLSIWFGKEPADSDLEEAMLGE